MSMPHLGIIGSMAPATCEVFIIESIPWVCFPITTIHMVVIIRCLFKVINLVFHGAAEQMEADCFFREISLISKGHYREDIINL